jgi:osmoprotectant transport system ATP-binding protein
VQPTASLDDYLENALAAMLLTDYGWVAVLDGDDFVGVLTPDAIYRALRTSLDEAEATASSEPIGATTNTTNTTSTKTGAR